MWIPLSSPTFSGEQWVNFVGSMHTLKFHKHSFEVADIISSIEDPIRTTNRRELPTVSYCIAIIPLALQIQQ
jgi:hypothetical protein